MDDAFCAVEVFSSTTTGDSADFFCDVRGFLESGDLGSCILRFFDDVDSEPRANGMTTAGVDAEVGGGWWMLRGIARKSWKSFFAQPLSSRSLCNPI